MQNIKGDLKVLRELQSRWFKFTSGNQSEILNIQLDPTSTSLDAPKGSVAIREDNSAIYIKLDDGDSTNWRKISDLVTFATIAEAKAYSGSDNLLAFVVGNSTFYRYETNGSAYTANDGQYLITGDGGDTRWIAVAGENFINERFRQYAQTIKACGFQYSGSENESSISFNTSTREFSLTPSSLEVIWRQEERFELSSAISVIIDNTEGRWYIYYGKDSNDSGTVQLRATQSFTNAMRKREPLVASIYWDATNGKAIVRDERHTASMPAENRFIKHDTKGSFIKVSGGDVTANYGNGSLAVHSQISVSDLVLVDEDIQRAITGYSSAPAQIPMVYLDGSNVRWDTATNVVAKITSGQAYYNNVVAGSGSQVAVADGKFVCSHIIAIGGESSGLIAVQGRAVYDLANDAFAYAQDEVESILNDMTDFFEDASCVATVVFEANQSFVNDVKVAKNYLNLTSIDWVENAYNVVNRGKSNVIGSVSPNEVKSNIRDRRTTTGDTTMSFVSDDVLWCDTSLGSITVTLPAATSEYDGYSFTIKKTKTSNSVIISGNGANIEDSASNYELISGNRGSITLQTDGVEWFAI